MMNNVKRRPIYLVILVCFVLLFAACSSEMQSAPQEAEVIVPTVIVQQYVTKVVATAVPSESEPTAAPPKPTAQTVKTTGWDPMSAPIYYPIMGCVASRMHVGERAFVAYGAETNGIHYSQEIGDAPIYRHLYPGEIMEIVDGPYCERGAIVWKVFALADEQVGFVGEGNGDVYWLLPLPPGEKSLYKQHQEQEVLSRLFGGKFPVYKPPPGTCNRK